MKSLKKIDLRKKIIVANVIIILIICAVVFFVIMPSINDIASMQSNIQSQYFDLEKKYLKGQNLRKLSENLNSIQPKMAKLDQIFISKDQELDFVTTLENLATKNNITQKISMSPPAMVSNYSKTPIQIATTGNFNNQVNYLKSIEGLPYMINVKSIEITPVDANRDSNTTGTGVVNILFTMDTFWK